MSMNSPNCTMANRLGKKHHVDAFATLLLGLCYLIQHPRGLKGVNRRPTGTERAQQNSCSSLLMRTCLKVQRCKREKNATT